MNKTRLAAIIAAGALAVAGCGDEDSPDTGATAKGNGVDRAFATAMLPHHRSAVQMAEIALQRGEGRFVKDLARDIIRTQTEEIDLLRSEERQLADAPGKQGSLGVPEHMTGMDADPTMLRTAKPFDREFIEMMIPHHEGAIEMAKAELARGADPELKSLAEKIIAAQQREIDEMRKHLGDPDAGEDGEH